MQLSGFEIIEPLFTGPSLSIYRGRQISLDRLVTITVVSDGFSGHPGDIAHVLKEARRAARLKNTGIVQLYDARLDGDVVHIISEDVEGVRLEEILAGGNKIDVADALSLLRRVAETLESVWARTSLVHGALTPADLWLDTNGIKISGLGLHSVLEMKHQASGAADRMAAYRAPEYAPGARADAARDIYALGIIAMQMISGLPPGEIAARIRAGESGAAALAIPGVAPDLFRLLNDMTARDPAQRGDWPTLIHRLETVKTSSPVRAPVDRKPVEKRTPAPAAAAPRKKVAIIKPVHRSVPAAAAPVPGLPAGIRAGAWLLVLLLWSGAGYGLYRLPAPVTPAVREPDMPTVGHGAPALAASVSPAVSESGNTAVTAETAGVSVAVPDNTAPPIEAQQWRNLQELADSVASYLVREEYDLALGAMDLASERSDAWTAGPEFQALRQFVNQVAGLNNSVAAILRGRMNSDVIMSIRGETVRGQITEVSGQRIVLAQTFQQGDAEAKREYSLAVAELDPLERARWLGDAVTPVRNAMHFILAARSRQSSDLIRRYAENSGPLREAFLTIAAAPPRNGAEP